MPKVFISYSRSDKIFVDDIVNELADIYAETDINFWQDSRNIIPGQKWEDEVVSNVRSSNAVIFFLSQRSITSKHCLRECRIAFKRKIPIIPVEIEPLDIEEVPLFIRRLQIFNNLITNADDLEGLKSAIEYWLNTINQKLHLHSNINPDLIVEVEDLEEAYDPITNEINLRAAEPTEQQSTILQTMEDNKLYFKEIVIQQFPSPPPVLMLPPPQAIRRPIRTGLWVGLLSLLAIVTVSIFFVRNQPTVVVIESSATVPALTSTIPDPATTTVPTHMATSTVLTDTATTTVPTHTATVINTVAPTETAQAFTASPSPVGQEIAYNNPIDGNITSKDDPNSNIFYFHGQKDTIVSIELQNRNNTQLDPYLELYLGQSNSLLAEDNNSGVENNASIVTVLPEDGDYFIKAKGYDTNNSGKTGDFRLDLKQIPSEAYSVINSNLSNRSLAKAEPYILASEITIENDDQIVAIYVRSLSNRNVTTKIYSEDSGKEIKPITQNSDFEYIYYLGKNGKYLIFSRETDNGENISVFFQIRYLTPTILNAKTTPVFQNQAKRTTLIFKTNTEPKDSYIIRFVGVSQNLQVNLYPTTPTDAAFTPIPPTSSGLINNATTLYFENLTPDTWYLVNLTDDQPCNNCILEVSSFMSISAQSTQIGDGTFTQSNTDGATTVSWDSDQLTIPSKFIAIMQSAELGRFFLEKITPQVGAEGVLFSNLAANPNNNVAFLIVDNVDKKPFKFLVQDFGGAGKYSLRLNALNANDGSITLNQDPVAGIVIPDKSNFVHILDYMQPEAGLVKFTSSPADFQILVLDNKSSQLFSPSAGTRSTYQLKQGSYKIVIFSSTEITEQHNYHIGALTLKGKVTVNTKVRAEPNPTAPVKTTLSSDSAITLTGKSGDNNWVQIAPDGYWISSDNIAIEGGTLEDIPIIP